jgi:hypothetical protein
MEVRGQLHTPGTLPLGKEPHRMGGWVGPTASLEKQWSETNSLPLLRMRPFNPSSSSPQPSHCTEWCSSLHIVARVVLRLYGLTTGFIGSHTVTHNYSEYTLQLTTVHYNTCQVFTLYLHWLPVFQYRRIRSPATMQLFSEDCCSARTLTRNWNCPRHC